MTWINGLLIGLIYLLAAVALSKHLTIRRLEDELEDEHETLEKCRDAARQKVYWDKVERMREH